MKKKKCAGKGFFSNVENGKEEEPHERKGNV